MRSRSPAAASCSSDGCATPAPWSEHQDPRRSSSRIGGAPRLHRDGTVRNRHRAAHQGRPRMTSSRSVTVLLGPPVTSRASIPWSSEAPGTGARDRPRRRRAAGGRRHHRLARRGSDGPRDRRRRADRFLDGRLRLPLRPRAGRSLRDHRPDVRGPAVGRAGSHPPGPGAVATEPGAAPHGHPARAAAAARGAGPHRLAHRAPGHGHRGRSRVGRDLAGSGVVARPASSGGPDAAAVRRGDRAAGRTGCASTATTASRSRRASPWRRSAAVHLR